MKEKAAAFSHDNLKCLSAIIMIILNLKEIKQNFKNKLEIFKNKLELYKQIVNFGYLECPHCHSSNLIKWGSYERNAIFFDIDEASLKSKLIKIQRVRCKSCGKTHALLPCGIIPYKQFTSEIVVLGLMESFNDNILNFINKYGIDESIVKNNYNDFKKLHLSRLKSFLPDKSILESLEIIMDDEYQTKYINRYNRCFMQIKLGIIGTMPLLRGAPT